MTFKIAGELTLIIQSVHRRAGIQIRLLTNFSNLVSKTVTHRLGKRFPQPELLITSQKWTGRLIESVRIAEDQGALFHLTNIDLLCAECCAVHWGGSWEEGRHNPLWSLSGIGRGLGFKVALHGGISLQGKHLKPGAHGDATSQEHTADSGSSPTEIGHGCGIWEVRSSLGVQCNGMKELDSGCPLN